MRTIKNLLVGVGLLSLAMLYEHSQRRQEMNRQTRRVWTYFFIAVFLIGIINLLSCTRYTPVVSMPMSMDWLAVTICDQKDNPVIVENALYPEYLGKKYTLVHEHMHVEQTKRYGGCWRFQERYESEPQFHWMMEAEARCAEIIMASHEGVPTNYGNLVATMQTLGIKLHLMYTSDDVKDLLPCKEDANAKQWKSAPP